MVIRTAICSFSEFKIYPGRGKISVAKDGRNPLYLNKKTESFGNRKIRAHKITWTVAWRRHNRKL